MLLAGVQQRTVEHELSYSAWRPSNPGIEIQRDAQTLARDHEAALTDIQIERVAEFVLLGCLICFNRSQSGVRAAEAASTQRATSDAQRNPGSRWICRSARISRSRRHELDDLIIN